MARPQLGSRLMRFKALEYASRKFPALARAVPFAQDVRFAIDVGQTVETFTEERDVVLTPSESELAERLPNPPRAHVRRDIALLRLENVTILGNTGRVIDESRGVLLRSRLEVLAVQVNDFRAETSRVVAMPPANYVYLMGEHSGHAHFFHFLFDRLPRLFYLLERFSLGREPLVILSNENPPPFQRDIFGFIGARYSNVRFAQIPSRERWRLPQLLFIDDYNTTTRATFLARETLDWMRDLILEGYGIRPNAPRRRLYVNRGDTRKRRLLNEGDIWPLFAAKGFDSVSAANLSFREQAAMFSEAEAIAGPHGAGLSHSLFAPGVKTLEIFPLEKAFDIDYFYLTKAVGGTYDAVIGTRGNRLGHFRIDPAQIAQALQRL
jgi:capsular polysaccharide biosynthesis protein